MEVPEYSIVNMTTMTALDVKIAGKGIFIPPMDPPIMLLPGINGMSQKWERQKTTVTMFESGKITTMGSKSFGDARQAVRMAVNGLKSRGVAVPERFQTEITNIVAKSDLGRRIDFSKIEEISMTAYGLGQFGGSGAKYRMRDPEAVFTLQPSGKVTCMKTRNERDLKRALGALVVMLEERGLFADDGNGGAQRC